MATSREELETYRERVFQELATRTARVKELDTALASNRYLLDRADISQGLRSGNTRRVLADASHKARLTRERERLERQRKEAWADLKRAEDRLGDVNRELDELEEREGAGVSVVSELDTTGED